MPVGIYKRTKPGWNKGMKMSLEFRKRLSDAHKKRGTRPPNQTGFKMPPHVAERQRLLRTGVPLKEETKAKLRKICGPLHHNWKGGKTDESKLQRGRVEYRLWRESVFVRDDHTCQKCLKRGGELHPHHLMNFHKYVGLRYAIYNGVTLCVPCHKAFHRKFGRTDNNKTQFESWTN